MTQTLSLARFATRSFLALCCATAATAQIGLKLQSTATDSPSVNVKSDPTLVPTNGITVEAWMTFDETTANNNSTLLRHTVGSTGVGSVPSYNLRVESPNSARRLAFKIRTAGGTRGASYTFAASEFKTWTHVAGTYDGSLIRLFINGVQQASNTQSGAIADQGGDLAIGSGGRKNNTETWNGEIDEVRLWPYARTEAEIQSTMNLALSNVPGQVSTWSLDFTPADGSGNNNGTNFNSPNYATNSLTLTATDLGVTSFGNPTAGCVGTPALGASGYAEPGNSGFALMCLNGATPAGVGFFWLGVSKLSSSVPLLGAELWVDTGAPGLLIPVTGDALGLVRVDLPIPATAPSNASVHVQMVFNEAGCSVPLFASEGLTITTK